MTLKSRGSLALSSSIRVEHCGHKHIGNEDEAFPQFMVIAHFIYRGLLKVHKDTLQKKGEKKLYRDVGLVHVVLSSFLGNEQHPLEEEEAASVLGSQDMKGAFQHQLSIGGQVRTLPIDQKRLDLLEEGQDTHRHTCQHMN